MAKNRPMTTAERQQQRDSVWRSPRAQLRLVLAALIIVNVIVAAVWWNVFRWEDVEGDWLYPHELDSSPGRVLVSTGCYREDRVVVVSEDPFEVVVHTQKRGDSLGDCAGYGWIDSAEPVGNRLVVDARNGRRWVRDPSDPSTFVLLTDEG